MPSEKWRTFCLGLNVLIPDSKIHRANMGPTWVQVGFMNLAIRDISGARTGIIWDTMVNTMMADALVPYVARTSFMIVTVTYLNNRLW